jgi:AraC-like DNA-binding protein
LQKDCIFSTSFGEVMPETLESQLAYLGFHLFSPSPFLGSYVREYWYLRRETPLVTYHEEYMHPRGGFGIVFNLGDKLCLDGQTVFEPIFLDGANTVSRKLGFRGKVELMGVRFHEGGAYPFLGVPLNELRNEIVLLDALDRPGLLRLHARLTETKSLSARTHLLEGWLMSRLSFGKERPAIIPASLSLLREREGQLPIPELARDLAMSQRQLERLYQAQVGISPKQYSLLLRVERARLALRRMDKQTSILAAELGFCDQPHFIREFRAVIGMTPYDYIKRDRRQSEAM